MLLSQGHISIQKRKEKGLKVTDYYSYGGILLEFRGEYTEPGSQFSFLFQHQQGQQ